MAKTRFEIALIADLFEVLYGSANRFIGKEYERLIAKGEEDEFGIVVEFDISESEYDALVSIGNRLRDSMTDEEEYRWDMLTSLIYEDLYVDENGVDRKGETHERKD